MPSLTEIAIDCLLKAAAPAWVRAIQKGVLSPSNVNRVAQSMPVGSFRTIKPLGFGQMNAAERVVGNLGPAGSGEMVRKLPLSPGVDLMKHYQPLVNASQAAEKVMPGATAPYLAATPRGVFQQNAGTANVIPPGVTSQGWQQTVRNKLGPLGFSDMHVDNFSPGGKLFDFQASQFGGAAAGGHVFNPMKMMKAYPPYGQAMNQAMSAPTPQLKEKGFNRALSMVPKMPHLFYDKPLRKVPAVTPPGMPKQSDWTGMFSSMEPGKLPGEPRITGRLLGGGAILAAAIALALQDYAMRNQAAKLKKITNKEVETLRNAAKLPKLPIFKDYSEDGNAYYASSPNENLPHGFIGFSPDMQRHAILAHEMGHADMEVGKPWYSPSKINQKYLRPISSFVAPIAAPAAGLIAGLATSNPLVGLGAGALAGGLLSAPTLINEWQASSRANDYMKRVGLKPDNMKQQNSALNHAYGTYVTSSMLPAALVGGATGALAYLGKHNS